MTVFWQHALLALIAVSGQFVTAYVLWKKNGKRK